MKYYIIMGEASGDLHSSNLMKEIIQRIPMHSILGWRLDEK
jgi:lipid-A-disaccharide synthase